jgi:hypothetical protein
MSGAQKSGALELVVHFLSDTSSTYGGFQMEYNPTGKQNTSIQNNTDYHIDRCRILLHSSLPGIFILF